MKRGDRTELDWTGKNDGTGRSKVVRGRIERNKTQWEGEYGTGLNGAEPNGTGRKGIGQAGTGRDEMRSRGIRRNEMVKDDMGREGPRKTRQHGNRRNRSGQYSRRRDYTKRGRTKLGGTGGQRRKVMG